MRLPISARESNLKSKRCSKVYVCVKCRKQLLKGRTRQHKGRQSLLHYYCPGCGSGFYSARDGAKIAALLKAAETLPAAAS